MVWHDFTYPLGHMITARHWHNVVPDGLHFTVADTGWGKAVWGKLYGQWLCEAGVFTYDFDKFDVYKRQRTNCASWCRAAAPCSSLAWATAASRRTPLAQKRRNT